MKICEVCSTPIEPSPGRGRRRKYHPECAIEAQRVRARERARRLAGAREYRSLDWARKIAATTGARAKKAGVPFDAAAVCRALANAPDRCPALGIELSAANGGRQGPQDNSATIDRITPELGYTEGNLCVMSWLANRIKHNAKPEEVLAVGQYLVAAAAEGAK